MWTLQKLKKKIRYTLFSSHSSKEAKEGEEGQEKIAGSAWIWDKTAWASRTNTKTGSFNG